jgi:hypothetical protein
MPWIFFPDACCSVVVHQDSPDLLVVRSRLPGDIERILGRNTAVEVTPRADYRFRATVSRQAFAEAVLRRLGGMTYTNVKAAVPKADQGRAYLMNRVWAAGLDAQIEASQPQRIVVDSFLEEDPEQLDIFRRKAPRRRPVNTEAHARSSDPDTSHAAAAALRPTETEAAVLDALARCPSGATASELVALMKGAWNTITPRLAPLCRKGFIRDSGERRKGPTNRSQIVWSVLQ